jgi:WD40 repeat protein/uncharacterized caspase-like protein
LAGHAGGAAAGVALGVSGVAGADEGAAVGVAAAGSLEPPQATRRNAKMSARMLRPYHLLVVLGFAVACGARPASPPAEVPTNVPVAVPEPTCPAFAARAEAPKETPRLFLQRLPAGELTGMAVSSQGQLALTSGNGEVLLGDLKTRAFGRALRRKNVGLGYSRWEAATWEPNGDRLQIITPWDVKTIDRTGVETTNPEKLSFPPDVDVNTTFWLTGSEAGDVALLTGPMGGELHALVWPRGQRTKMPHSLNAPGGITSMVFTPDGSKLAFSAGGREQRQSVYVVKGDGSEAPATPIAGARTEWTQVRAISNDGALIALSDVDADHQPTLVLAETTTGKVRWTHRFPYVTRTASSKQVTKLFGFTTFNRDRTQLIADTDIGLSIYDVASGRFLGLMGTRTWNHGEVAFANDDSVLVDSTEKANAVNGNRSFAAWSLRSGALERTFIRDLAVKPSIDRSAQFVFARADINRECRGENNIQVSLERRNATSEDVTASKRVLDASPKWPLDTATSFCTHGTVLGSVDPVRGRLLMSATFEETKAEEKKAKGGSFTVGHVLDLATNTHKPLTTPSKMDIAFSSDSFSLGGKYVFGYGDTQVAIWDAQSLAYLPIKWSGSLAKAKAQSFDAARDDSLIAVSHENVKASVFELPSGKLRRTIVSAKPINLVRFGGADLVLSHPDGSISFEHEGNVKNFPGDGGDVTYLAVSPNGKRAATLHADQALRIWDLATGAVEAALIDFPDEEYVAFTPGGAFAGTSEVGERIGWVFPSPNGRDFNVFRFEQFAAGFRREDLVSARLAGDTKDMGAPPLEPPRVELVGPPEVKGDHVVVHARASAPDRVDLVRAYVGGRPAASAAVCAASGEVTLSVPLTGGKNRVALFGFGPTGASSNATTFDVDGAAAKSDVWVVAVGVGSYPLLGPDFQLEAAVDDAQGIADAFQAQAGPGKLFANAHIQVLKDGQVDAASVARALDGLSAMKRDDLAIIAFSGHGDKPSATEDMVLVTGKTAATAESLRKTGIGWPILQERLARAPGRVLLLLDACHSGHLTQTVAAPNDALAAELNRSQRAGAVVFAATKGRQLSYEANTSRSTKDRAAVTTAAKEIGSGRHGFFTGALLAALTAPETDRDDSHTIELSELVDEVRGRVARATGGVQVPWVVRQEVFGDFTVGIPRAGAQR